MQPLARIPLLYLDTNHIIEIVRLRRGRSHQSMVRQDAYRRISQAVTGGYCRVLFNPASCMEWVDGNRPEKPWEELGEFFESAKLVAEVEVGVAYTIELIERTREVIQGFEFRLPAIVRGVGEIEPAMIAFAQYHPELAAIRQHRPRASPPHPMGIREWVAGVRAWQARSVRREGGRMGGCDGPHAPRICRLRPEGTDDETTACVGRRRAPPREDPEFGCADDRPR
jgi:hypothetical protein